MWEERGFFFLITHQSQPTELEIWSLRKWKSVWWETRLWEKGRESVNLEERVILIGWGFEAWQECCWNLLVWCRFVAAPTTHVGWSESLRLWEEISSSQENESLNLVMNQGTFCCFWKVIAISEGDDWNKDFEGGKNMKKDFKEPCGVVKCGEEGT